MNFRGDYDVDDLIDCIEGNRKFVKCLYVYNKIDTISLEEVNDIAQDPNCAVISAMDKLGFDILREKIWDMLGMVRVYTKRKGARPDFDDPLILTDGRHGTLIKGAILQIHKVSSCQITFRIYSKTSSLLTYGARV